MLLLFWNGDRRTAELVTASKTLDLCRSHISHCQVNTCDLAWRRRELADVWNLRSSELSPSVIDMMRRSMQKPSLPSNNPSKLIMLKIAWGYWSHMLAEKHNAIAIKMAKEVDSVVLFCFDFGATCCREKLWIFAMHVQNNLGDLVLEASVTILLVQNSFWTQEHRVITTHF